MQQRPSSTPSLARCLGRLATLLAWLPAGCSNSTPSAQLVDEIKLPVPLAPMAVPTPDRFSKTGPGETLRLTPRSLITVAFNRQPEIKSSFHRFKAEEARYDFFYTSRDSLTPRFSASNAYSEARADEGVTRQRDHAFEFGVEKRFFDTSELNVAVGLGAGAADEAIGNHPFVSARLRYPLWASREKLERTSEEIFWRNQVDDAQLGYIQSVRWKLESTLFQFHEVVRLRRQVEHTRRWQSDLEQLLERLKTPAAGRDTVSDRQRVEAEIAKVMAEVRNITGRYEIDFERLKSSCGVPFHTDLELVDEPFNPFEGVIHEELFRLSVETDPEIATLRNSVRNAEVQLDLARRGRWDIALMFSGNSNLEGGGEGDGVSDWSASVGLDVSAVDARVTGSLIRQAEANIANFKQAIAARENAIFVDTLEPPIRIETLGKSRDELLENLPRYQADYDKGVAEYMAGRLNIDDLLKRRENLFEQEEQVSYLAYMVGANVAELCAATGRFFELLEADNGS